MLRNFHATGSQMWLKAIVNFFIVFFIICQYRTIDQCHVIIFWANVFSQSRSTTKSLNFFVPWLGTETLSLINNGALRNPNHIYAWSSREAQSSRAYKHKRTAKKVVLKIPHLSNCLISYNSLDHCCHKRLNK